MPIPDDKTKLGDDGKPISEKTTPTFDDNQQTFINEMFDKRFAKIQAKHAAELKAKEDEIAAAKALAEKPPVKKEGDDDPDKKQFKALLDGEKARTAAEKAGREASEKRTKEVEAQNLSIRKTQALRDAASKHNFHELSTIIKLTDENVVWSDEHNTWVVMEEGVVKNNASLQPMSLEDFYGGYAGAHPYLVNGDVKSGAGSGPSSKQQGGLGVVRSKADVKTRMDKVNYIAKLGLEAWEKLPVK